MTRLGVLVLGGFMLVYLRPILVPIVFAGLLSFLLLPLVSALVRRGLSFHMSILIAECVATLPVLAVIFIFATTVGPLKDALPKYQQGLTRQINRGIENILERVESVEQRKKVREVISRNLLPKILSEGVQLIQVSFQTVTTLMGYVFLTLLISLFMLLEAPRFREKFLEAFGEEHPVNASLAGIGRDVRAYVVAKTAMSVLTAFFVWGFLELLSVDFSLFWGLLALSLNFIPTVGAVIASIPPIVIALVDPLLSIWTTIGLTLGLLLIHGIIGSLLDPRFVGQTVKLSPLVVFLSMLIWGLLWGPVGMLLAVPMMVSVKVICTRIPALEPIAILMRG